VSLAGLVLSLATIASSGTRPKPRPTPHPIRAGAPRGLVAASPPQIYPPPRVLPFRPLVALAFTLVLPTCASSDECSPGESRACDDECDGVQNVRRRPTAMALLRV
jgi:hypothetical protein